MTTRARLAWSLAALVVVLGGVHTWLFFGWATVRQASSGWPILTTGAVLMAVLGSLIVTRVPGHRIGWLFVLGGISLALGAPLDAYAVMLRADGYVAPASLEHILAWQITLFDLAVPGTLLVLTFLLFPDGSLPTRRWRPLLWAVVATLTLFVLAVVANVRPLHLYEEATAETMAPYAPVAYGVLVIALLLEVFVAAVSVFLRLRRAEGEERQQLLWICSAAFFVAVGLAVAIAVEPLGLGDVIDDRLRTLPLHLAVVAVPVAAGLAVLRYRLYDLDVVLNRAIVLTALTAFVAAGYVVVVVAIGWLVGAQAQGRFWPSLLATATVALAFQPVRRGVLRFADRLVYGPRAAPYEALADFSAGLDRAPSPGQLTSRLAHAVGLAVAARQVVVELELPDLAEAGARWTRDRPGRTSSGVETRVALRDRNDHVGWVSVVTDSPLTADRRRLVEHLAHQAAAALRNAHLEAELSARVAELSRQADELQQARRDLLAARDGERARLAIALDRRVVSHLATLPTDLARLAVLVEQAPGETAQVLRRHLEEVGRALEELRELTRRLAPGPAAPVPR
ncbi:MAG TPA: hypothetical protein VFR74_07200 [Jiangellales bacterium]|nr:hypothetical protein [Jiangellales bacterium]